MIEERLSLDVEAGARAFPMFSTEIIDLDGGGEVRNSRWLYPKHRFEFNLSPDLRDGQAYLEFRSLWYACAGAHETFRFTHWADFSGDHELLGVGTGAQTQFQLVKNYTSGAITRQRKITRPIEGTVIIYVNGVAVAGTVDTATGIVTLNVAAPNGQQVRASFEYDIEVRFMDDEIELVGLTDQLEQPVSITLIEVRP